MLMLLLLLLLLLLGSMASPQSPDQMFKTGGQKTARWLPTSDADEDRMLKFLH